MKILLASSELYPFSKTGGLADMAGALGKALVTAGHEVVIVTPLYRGILAKYPQIRRFEWYFNLPLGKHRVSSLRGPFRSLNPSLACACASFLSIARNSLIAAAFTTSAISAIRTTPIASSFCPRAVILSRRATFRRVLKAPTLAFMSTDRISNGACSDASDAAKTLGWRVAAAPLRLTICGNLFV